MDGVFKTLLEIRNQRPFEWDHVENVCVLMQHMVPLPVGITLWHAAPAYAQELNSDNVLAVSTERQGAEAYARKSNMAYPYQMFQLDVVDPPPLGLPISSDPFYEDEKEILLAPGFRTRPIISRKGINHVLITKGDDEED